MAIVLGPEGTIGGSRIGGTQETLAELLDLLRRPAWMADAACAEHDRAIFFPGPGQAVTPAKAVCAGCLVLEECREYALTFRDGAGLPLDGVWGGLSANERKQLQRLRTAS